MAVGRMKKSCIPTKPIPCTIRAQIIYLAFPPPRRTQTQAANASSQPEEPQHIVRLLGHRVPHALRKDRLKVGPVGRARVPRQRVIRRVRARALGVAEDVGPLLDLLVEVLRVERRVPAITQSAPRVTPHPTPGGKNTHAVPCQTCIFGRAPSYPGYASYTRCAHC